MDVVAGRCRVVCALFCLFCATFIDGLREIPAQLGQTVKLSCPAQDDMTGLFLTRSDLEPPVVFVFRDSRPDLTKQNKQFVDRVTLPGPLVANADGDVILLLRNVSWADNGTYTCAVHKAGAGPVETSFDLRVVGPGGAAPPTGDPPTGEPPTGEPPTEEPPTGEPPTEEPPTGEPPTEVATKFILIIMYVCSFIVACFVSYILLTDHYE